MILFNYTYTKPNKQNRVHVIV